MFVVFYIAKPHENTKSVWDIHNKLLFKLLFSIKVIQSEHEEIKLWW